MLIDFVHILHSLVAQNLYLALGFIFIIALAEALLVIGLFVPSTLVIVGAGTLVVSGALPFWQLLIAATLGAVVGDAISYWLGRIYGKHLKNYWPLKNFPHMVSQGEAFFQKRGMWSVFIGRFIPAVKSVIPGIAGMMGMGDLRFTIINVTSSLAWAGAHVGSGMLIGLGVRTLSGVSVRLAIIVGILLLLLWCTWYVLKWGYAYGLPIVTRILQYALAFAQKITPAHLYKRFFQHLKITSAESLIFLGIFIGGLWLFFGMTEGVLFQDPLIRFDKSVYIFLNQLRTPFVDSIMVAITELGDTKFILIMALGAMAYLALQRAWPALIFWGASLIGGSVLIKLLKYVIHRARPQELYEGVSSFSFPSGHATGSMVAYMALAFLISRAVRPVHRWKVYAVSALLVVSIGFSRIYLGAHWFSDVVAGFGLGIALIALLAHLFVYYEHKHKIVPVSHLGKVVIGTFLTLAAWYVPHKTQHDLAFYKAQTVQLQTMTRNEWQHTGWMKLPLWREDIEGDKEDLISLQYAGTFQDLSSYLIRQGWVTAPSLSWTSAMRWLSPHANSLDLPLLPKMMAGHLESAVFLKKEKDKIRAIHVWPSNYQIENGNHKSPLYLASMSRVEFIRVPWFIKIPKGEEISSANVNQSMQNTFSHSRMIPLENQGQQVWLLFMHK